jgi:thiol-disulfide isomerase/thioredoxin
MIWGVAGAIAVLYVIVASSAKPDAQKSVATNVRDPALLVGEMSGFQFAIAPSTAPEVPFFTNGKPQYLKDRRGKVVLLNLWATWCKPCLEELPSLNALQRAKGGAAFEVVAVAADPQGEARARAYLDRLGVTSLSLHMDEPLRLATAYGASAGLPLSVLYDRQGREIGRLRGSADWSSAEAAALIQAAIDAR